MKLRLYTLALMQFQLTSLISLKQNNLIEIPLQKKADLIPESNSIFNIKPFSNFYRDYHEK